MYHLCDGKKEEGEPTRIICMDVPPNINVHKSLALMPDSYAQHNLALILAALPTYPPTQDELNQCAKYAQRLREEQAGSDVLYCRALSAVILGRFLGEKIALPEPRRATTMGHELSFFMRGNLLILTATEWRFLSAYIHNKMHIGPRVVLNPKWLSSAFY